MRARTLRSGATDSGASGTRTGYGRTSARQSRCACASGGDRHSESACSSASLPPGAVGWRELKVGDRIQRLQAKEYTLHATGWVRTVSGAQSLIGVYLLAMWALTYFGHPFE